MSTPQYTLIKLPLRVLIEHNGNVSMDRDTEIAKGYLIRQGSSLLFDQIERLRGKPSPHIEEVILVKAGKRKDQEESLRHFLTRGFHYNGIHYSRFGKSASQAKEGVTAFVCDEIYQLLYRITQMDIPVEECVISRYEAQRCLVFSSCTLISGYMPNIVIIGEYEKTLKNQVIKYVEQQEREFTDRETGENITYLAREIREGCKDLKLSPFDGCGCHEREFMEAVNARLGLDYQAAGAQVRLPFIKGYSVYVPFRKILKEWGYEFITDIYGTRHPVDSIDCIWNTSMFKGHRLFLQKYGGQAWNEYMKTLKKYEFKLGISKYSHHVRHLDKYTRMNFQYLQCLDLWNPRYISCFENKESSRYDILDSANEGKIIRLARYTTSLFEKIIQGDKFYVYKFLGIRNTEGYKPESKYLEAVMINDTMLKDPAVRQFLYRKLQKSIDQAKVGKIYCSGFYHTGIGDMIGYLQYAVGEEPVGCLGEGELYSGNFKPGPIVSFRSPLVDPSEVNSTHIARNDLLRRWFGYLRDQDIVMFNMYDTSAPQQGGADFDGDIFLLSDDPLLISSKIQKPIILDIQDKAAARSRPYTGENLVEYEIMTRDNRIGEITNAATSIENRYPSNPEMAKRLSDDASLLRIMQGKEIDFLKTGLRWHMSGRLKKHLEQIPYFLLYNYPARRRSYEALTKQNRQAETEEEKVRPNAYRSPSPMNELCDYVCAWEKRKILWEHTVNDPARSLCLLTDQTLDLSDRRLLRICKKHVNQYAAELKRYLDQQKNEGDSEKNGFHMEAVAKACKEQLEQEAASQGSLDASQAALLANYVIKASYSSVSVSKAFAWQAYGEYIIDNLRSNTNLQRNMSIREVPTGTEDSLEYLGKNYIFKAGDTYVPM